jgi:hypothetical protein
MKQTATEYLFEKLWETPKDKLTWNAILEQAKEMGKQQMIDFNVSVMKKGLIEEGDMEWTDAYSPKIREVAEQYYKETYDK